MQSRRKPLIVRRQAALAAFRRWFNTCAQPILITGTPYCGKTFFTNQLRVEPECVAVHECRSEIPESLETATILRRIADQLVQRFPNLMLPALAQWTLLSDVSIAVDQMLAKPLASLPQPSKPVFIVIDNIQPVIYDLVLSLEENLPEWLRLIATTRELEHDVISEFGHFHFFDLCASIEDLQHFIELRLPQCSYEEINAVCLNSWFYVDQLAQAYESGILSYDCLPYGTEQLIHEISDRLPPRFTMYLLLIKAARHPPTHQELIGVSQFLVRDCIASIERDLDEMDQVFSCRDPYVLCGSWCDFIGDLSVYHSSWAELFKVKKNKQLQDVIELAFHLAHSDVPPTDCIRILRSLKAGDIILKCEVIDLPTTMLLERAGTVVKEQTHLDDFVFLCSSGSIGRVEREIEKASTRTLSHGLLAAAARGQVAICRKILEYRPQIAYFVSEDQWNALRSAACNNHLDVLNLLIEHGINVDDCGNGGRTALRAAAWSGHKDIVLRLINANANIEKTDLEGRTALMVAAFMDHFEVVDELIRHGANVQITDTSGATALHLILSNGSDSASHNKTIDTLLKAGSNVNIADTNGRTCLHLAAYHGDSNLGKIADLTESIDSQDLSGRTALMLASCQGQDIAANTLIEKGANIDVVDHEGRTALMHAAIHNKLSIVDLLLSLGADEAHRDNEGAVSLHYAVVHPSVELARALSTTATLSAIDDRTGSHPLIYAVQNGHLNVIKELLEAGAPANLQNWDSHSPLRIAAREGHTDVVELLASYVNDWEHHDFYGTPLVHTLLMDSQHGMASLLLQLGTPQDVKDVHGRTVAHIVAATNDVFGIRVLKKLHVNFEAADSGGRTPLHVAVWAGHAQAATYLLEHIGVNPNIPDQQGASALSIASQQGNRELAVLLLKFGADRNQRDNMGRTCADVARISGHMQITSLLAAACASSGSADSSGFGSMPNSPRVVQPRLFHTNPQVTTSRYIKLQE